MTSTRTAKLLASLLAISSWTLSCVPQPEADAGGGGGSRPASGGAGGGGGVVGSTGGAPGTGGAAASTAQPGSGGGPAAAGTGGTPSAPSGSTSSGGSTGAGSGGTAADAGGTTNMTPMTPATGAGGDPWASCQGVTFKPGISAQDYCTKFMSACGFGGADRFASMADCMTKYAGLSDGPTGGKACVA